MKVIIFGATGKMGRVLFDECIAQNIEVVECVDETTDIGKITEADCIIDFSTASALDRVLTLAAKIKCPVVIATTGYSDKQLEIIKQVSRALPIFMSANMSVGVNLLHKLIKTAAQILGDFDIEVIEKHHNSKIDAPSGTAIALTNTLREVFPEKYVTHGRSGAKGKRGNEICVHAVRGGSIVGEHDVLFIGKKETITLTHSAHSRDIFAEGAIRAAKFIVNQSAGLYNMADLLK